MLVKDIIYFAPGSNDAIEQGYEKTGCFAVIRDYFPTVFRRRKIVSCYLRLRSAMSVMFTINLPTSPYFARRLPRLEEYDKKVVYV